MRLPLAIRRLREVSLATPNKLLVCAFLLGAPLCLFGVVRADSPLPDWWRDAQSPAVRELGEKLSIESASEKMALGNLMLARHQETLGNLPRALRFVDEALDAESLENTDSVLATYLRASMLGRIGRLEDQRHAIEKYRLACETFGRAPVGLQSPGMMLVYNLAAAGRTQAARQQLDKLDVPADSDQLAERCFAEAVITSSATRDPAKIWKEVEEAFRTLGPKACLHNFALLNAASVYSERQFMDEQAEGFAKEAMKVRPEDTVFLPEAEIARLNLELCEWGRAAEWLTRAQQAKMVLRPNYRQEAIKDLKFAVSDFYLATGYPREARLALEGLEHDFFRPGYTTGSDEYYLCGLYLRRSLALGRELELAEDCWLRGDLAAKAHTFLPLLRLKLSLVCAKMQFRDNLLRRIGTATPGTDIAMLYYGPSWLLPAMREVVGKDNFASLARQFRPEGVRQEVLEPVIAALLGQKPPTGLHQATPKLLRAIVSAIVGVPADQAALVYRDAPSAFLLAGNRIPIGAADQIPLSGWLRRDTAGLALELKEPDTTGSARLELRDASGATLRLCQTTWPPSAAGKLEKLNVALASSVFPLDEQTSKKIEGRAQEFKTSGAAN